jgi:hypothetical protein
MAFRPMSCSRERLTVAAMEAPVEDRRPSGNPDPTRVFCEKCGHSELAHGDDVHGDDDGSCLYSVCQCSGFSKIRDLKDSDAAPLWPAPHGEPL